VPVIGQNGHNKRISINQLQKETEGTEAFRQDAKRRVSAFSEMYF